MHILIMMVIVGAGLFALGFLAYYSVQSIMQARVLSSPVRLVDLKTRLDQVVTLNGSPEPVGSRRGPDDDPCIWYWWRRQVYRRRGKNSSWVTVSEDKRGLDFDLHFPGGGRVRVNCEPTEVSGKYTRTDGGGWFEYERELHEWISADRQVTVMGKLVLSAQGATLVKHENLGMILTTRSPASAAAWEYAKGITGLLFVLACLVFAACFGLAVL